MFYSCYNRLDQTKKEYGDEYDEAGYPPKNRFATEIANFVKNGGQLYVVRGRRDIK